MRWCQPSIALGLTAAASAAPFTTTSGNVAVSELYRTGELVATHYWDCNGNDCDSKTLKPWDAHEYSASPLYAPMDPANHGGPSSHGENLWLTGAASDDLARYLGPDDDCCGSSDQSPGGCGKCLLVRNPDAVNSDWTAIVMKKNRCPPWSNGCGAGQVHLDLAVPGYDNVGASTSNVCGSRSKHHTWISRDTSEICGAWWERGDSTITGCTQCGALPAGDFREGCELFSAWGWRSGNPTLTFETVECPAAFKAAIGGAFGPDGPAQGDVSTLAPIAPPPPTAPTPAPLYTFGGQCGSNHDQDCDGCAGCDGCFFSWPSNSPQKWNDPDAACRCKCH